MNNTGGLPRRLRRLPSVRQMSPRYFLTLCTERRERSLASDSAHAAFVEFMRGSPGRYGWSCGEYVLMPDHAHYFAAPSPGAVTLGAWVKATKAFVRRAGGADVPNDAGSVTRPTDEQVVGRVTARGGPQAIHWQTGFFDHILRSTESNSEKWAYVRENPVRAGLVVKADDWPFLGQIDV